MPSRSLPFIFFEPIFRPLSLSDNSLSFRTIVNFIRKSREEGKCVVFSTHIMGEVSRLCDRLAVIHKGKLQYEGTLAEFRQQMGDDLEEAFVAILERAPA